MYLVHKREVACHVCSCLCVGLDSIHSSLRAVHGMRTFCLCWVRVFELPKHKRGGRLEASRLVFYHEQTIPALKLSQSPLALLLSRV